LRRETAAGVEAAFFGGGRINEFWREHMKKGIAFYLLILALGVLAGIGVDRAFRANQDRLQAGRSRDLREAVRLADAEPDNVEAVRQYEAVKPSPPEVELRILARQWAIALEKLREIRRIRDNLSLHDEVPVRFGKLKELLDSMNERCLALLSDAQALPPEAVWRAYNLQGAVKLLNSFAVTETERNVKKATAIFREAITHLKAAIDAVDLVPASGLERNIPRWNLELLYSEQILERFQLVQPDTQRQLDLNNNLEAILPDQGGYAPGEPIDRIIRK
jgi:hypothetical protein